VTDPRPRALADLPIWQGRLARVVVETPKGSGNKLKFDPDLGAMLLDRVLPAGMTFPFDFGFIPATVADDGDPLDAIVLLDSPVHPGCVVPARLIGELRAEQREGRGPWSRNDRLLAVAAASKAHAGTRSVRDMDRFLLESIGAFFTDYHRLDGDSFRVVGRGGPAAARRSVQAAHRRVRGSGSAGTAKKRA
jgi:inorganic pyrophosphatase